MHSVQNRLFAFSPTPLLHVQNETQERQKSCALGAMEGSDRGVALCDAAESKRPLVEPKKKSEERCWDISNF